MRREAACTVTSRLTGARLAILPSLSLASGPELRILELRRVKDVGVREHSLFSYLSPGWAVRDMENAERYPANTLPTSPLRPPPTSWIDQPPSHLSAGMSPWNSMTDSRHSTGCNTYYNLFVL
ncbi:hypothetical protein DFH06DRAFT_1488572 [Mycena polygramma]|nr:hypothetical protein DFH06DRAFT_1488572 [Mycena polygramma]